MRNKFDPMKIIQDFTSEDISSPRSSILYLSEESLVVMSNFVQKFSKYISTVVNVVFTDLRVGCCIFWCVVRA